MPQLHFAFPKASDSRSGWPWDAPDLAIRNGIASGQVPRVSIVTPSFNQGEFIEETIRSVLLQNYPNLEYIIIDGGSTDNTLEIIKRYEPWLSYWVSERDHGQADAINKGFSKCTGTYIGWLNSDDYLYQGAIGAAVQSFASDSSIDMVFGDVDEGWSGETSVRKRYGKERAFSEMLRTLDVSIPQQGSLWKRTVLDSVGMLDARWHVVLDREFFHRISERCVVRHIPATLAYFRYHTNSKSSSMIRQWLNELPRMYSEFFAKPDLTQEIRKLKHEAMGSVFVTCASLAMRCKDPALALRYAARALQTDPRLLLRGRLWSKVWNFIKAHV
jgi:glycosyltransferase involved in cell wall biosynthesis